MEYTRLGNTGLEVSKIILGCMSFGDPGSGRHEWTLSIDKARSIIHQALEAGITTFDTANVYSAGTSEEIVGEVLGELADREEVVIATKVHGQMAEGPKGSGLSRAAIFTQVDKSLQRLGTDYIDLYQIHRYDEETPIEETLEALHDLIRSGKVRYIGASSMWTWQFAQAQYLADLNGWSRFVSMQDQYNLMMREEEREMLPFCLDEGVGVLPWSPLARGNLAREWNTTTKRSKTDKFGDKLYRQDEEADRKIVRTVGEIADKHNISRAQVALAWLLHKPAVTAPIVGVTKTDHLEDAIKAVDVQLSDDDLTLLEKYYTPRSPEGF
ncbi:MAG TPA: aldo/keto reductase [Balneolaceae bacterium]|nr:aldo/keto reductase [Balneolaceae bacterium]